MPLLARDGGGEPFSFTFDDEPIDAWPGDTIAAALIDAGRLMTSRSTKYRRPRGPYCLAGDCGTCWLRVAGQPNVRACTTPARAGLTTRSQNTFTPMQLDPTALVDRVFGAGFDHHHFMVRPRLANLAMQAVARELAGFGELPDLPFPGPAEHRAHDVTALVVGLGPAGRACVAELARAGIDSLALDRRERDELSAEGELPAFCLARTGVFAAYEGEGLWAAAEEGAHSRILHTVRARHVVLAPGSRDPMLVFPGNDRPGVVSARGLLRMLRRCGARLAVPCVVVGTGPWAAGLADELRCEAVDPGRIEATRGSAAVEMLVLRDGREIPCRLVAVAAPPAPAHELPAQAGAAVRWDGAGFAVVREESGRCGRFAGTQLWAAGDVAGHRGPDAAAADGVRIGRQVAATIEQLGETRG